MAVVVNETLQGGQDKHAPRPRRNRTLKLRSLREELTSDTGLTLAFDQELVLQLAQGRINASAIVFLMVIAISVGAYMITGSIRVFIWLCVLMVAETLLGHTCSRILALPKDLLQPRAAIRRLAVLGAVSALTWAFLAAQIIGQAPVGAVTFVIFMMMMTVAMATVIYSPVTIVMYVGAIPISLVVMISSARGGTVAALAYTVMSGGAFIYFMLLGRRLREASIEALRARAEKDSLIMELEQAKANSDEARSRAEEANLAKSRFLATMSHELRTPLNAILGFSEVMKSEVFGPLTVPNYKEYVSDIHGSGQHLLNLINEILDLSRIEAGRYELNQEAMSLVHIAEESVHLLKLRAKSKGIVIHEHFQEDMPSVWVDERAIRQVVLNLLSNAIKFTPSGGEVTIKAGWTRSGGQYVMVVDTGPGIPEEEIPTILSSFGRGSLAIKTAEQGTGLGLPIVKGLIDLHGGKFTLRSKLRQGTEVMFTIPAELVMQTLPPVIDTATTQRSPDQAIRAA